MKLFVSTEKGLKAIPDPPHGFGYLPVAIPNELLHKIQRMEANGSFERELSGLLSREIVNFFERRPAAAGLIRVASQDEIVKFYDPRDPQKHPLDRRPNVI